MRNYLSNIDLTQYKLVIDLHRDAAGSKIIRQLEDGDCTVVKFVFSTSNKNYHEQQNLANKISANLQDIYDEDFTYDKGILNFNQDLSNNIVLIENGFNTNISGGGHYYMAQAYLTNGSGAINSKCNIANFRRRGLIYLFFFILLFTFLRKKFIINL